MNNKDKPEARGRPTSLNETWFSEALSELDNVFGDDPDWVDWKKRMVTEAYDSVNNSE